MRSRHDRASRMRAATNHAPGRLSPKQIATAVESAEARYLARLSPGRRGSLTTVALRVLLTSLREDYAATRKNKTPRRTTWTRHRLREAVGAHPDLRRRDFLLSSFNTTPEELSVLLEKFFHEETLEGRQWQIRFSGPTRTARDGEGAKEELYLVVHVTPSEVSLGASDQTLRKADTPGAEPDSLHDRYRAIWTAGLPRTDAIRKSQQLLRDTDTRRLVYTAEDVILELDRNGAGTAEQRITALNLGDAPLACESFYVARDTAHGPDFPITVSARGQAVLRLERQIDNPHYQQFTIHFVPPLPPGRGVEFSIHCPLELKSSSWSLSIRRFIHRLRFIVRDRRPGSLRALSLATETPRGIVQTSNPPIEVTTRRGITQLTWTQAFPELHAGFRFYWTIT